ncbi:MAG: hypothetical protein VYA17_09340 [Pseudomonadota bacterium]|nr:hypothetical protein [Pseudomonadota bacterium]
MTYGLEEFCNDARSVLSNEAGPCGRDIVARHLEKLLVDAEFVDTYLGLDKRSGAETIYTDPALDFHVMAHTNRGASNNTPHCHGPSWVIYGMAMNYVDMTEWKRIDDGTEKGFAKLEVTTKYRLNEGEARVYNEGIIHSLDRPLETRLVRFTGCDLDRTLRYRYDSGKNTVKVLNPSP